MKQRRVIRLSVLLTCLYHFGFVSALSAQESYYKGKSIHLIVGSTPGGFYDRWARLFAKYMPSIFRAIPK
jgi:hypothetical protein